MKQRGVAALRQRAQNQIFLKDRESELSDKSKDCARKRVLLKLIVLLKRRFVFADVFMLFVSHILSFFLFQDLRKIVDTTC